MLPDFFRPIVSMSALPWLAVASLLLLHPISLGAHGTLVRSVPAAETKVSERPSEIRLWFNESIEHRFSRITVHRAKRDEETGKVQPQQRVDEGLVDGPRVTRELAVKLPATLTPGLYLVQWQVFSIDSHRTTGKFTLTYEPPADKVNPSR